MASNKDKSIAAVNRLRTWIDTNPMIPQHHGKLNKTKICQIIGVPVSTIRTNQELGKLLGELASKVPAPPKRSPQPKQLADVVGPLLQKIDDQRSEIDELRSLIAEMQLLYCAGVLKP